MQHFYTPLKTYVIPVLTRATRARPNPFVGLTLCMLLLVHTPPANAETLGFMSGSAGGSWYPLAGAVKKIVEEEVDTLHLAVRPGNGVINPMGVGRGRVHLAWSAVVSSVDAIKGRAPFRQALPDICNLGVFHNNFLQMATLDPDIRDIEDFAGKRLGTTPRGSTGESILDAVLASAELTRNDLGQLNFAGTGDLSNMLKDGHLDVWINFTSAPNGSFLDLATARRAFFLTLTNKQFSHLLSHNQGWQHLTMPADTYPGQNHALVVPGSPTHLAVHCNKVSDEDAYAITAALIKRVHELGAVLKVLDHHSPAAMATEIGVPFHRGALQAYQAHGVLP